MEPGPEMVDKVLRNMFGSSEVRVTYEAPPPQPSPPWHAWACMTACLVMFFVMVGMGIMYLDLNRKYDRMQDYQNTTYMLVPEFRALVNKELERRKEK